MSIIALFSGSYCNDEELAEKVAQRLGYRCIGEEEILEEAARKHGAAQSRLARTLYGPSSFFKESAPERAQNVAYVRAALAERICKDNIVYHGFATHLLPKNVAHVLKVCLVADHDHKIALAMEQDGLAERDAREAVKKDNEQQLEWVRYLFDRGPWDESLYDMVISIPAHSIEDRADLICTNAQKEVLKSTPESQQAVKDFLLAARVYLPIARKWPEIEVTCTDGDVTLLINKYILRLEHLKKKLSQIVSSVPGVKSVRAGFGPKCKRPAIHRDLDFEMPSKILLVDDEREFVETLSERLLARDVGSAVAYNGEEALSQVEKDEPEVMVLDLKMPGIDGIEVLRRVKRERPNVEVIILTGHGSDKDKALAEELGAFAYLEKPVDIGLLTETMKEAHRKIHEDEAARENPEKATE